jgi:hypothetical protein
MIDYCAPGAFGLLWSSWQALCFLAIFASIVLLSLLYVAGNFFRMAGLQAWVKAEMGQLVVSALIVIMVVSIVAFLCSFDPSVLDKTYSGGRNMFAEGTEYLNWLKYRNTEALWLVYGQNVVVSMMMNPVYNSRPGGVGVTTQPFAGLAPISSMLVTFMSGLTLSLLLTEMQIYILQYIQMAMLGWFLPLGVFFRCFEPTRQFGGALIGLAIGLFLLYPALLVMNEIAVKGPFDAAAAEAGTVNPGSALANSDYIGLSNDFPAVGTEPSPGAGTMATNYQSVETNTANSVNWVIKITFYTFVGAMLLPALNFIVLITGVRDISRMLGEEVDVSNLTRMI